MIMKSYLIGLVLVFAFLLLNTLSSAQKESDPELDILSVAKCGYNCWPKYGAEGDGDLNVHKSPSQIQSNRLDDYQIGELRGCMEECLVKETDFYPPMDG